MSSIDPRFAHLVPYFENTLDRSSKIQAEHSKWLINTLYLLHSGAIAGILARAPVNAVSTYSCAIGWFAVGLALAFFAGLATWFNYRCMIVSCSKILGDIRTGAFTGDITKYARWPKRTEIVALVLGLTSFACLIVGTWIAYSVLTKPIPAT